ncbi:hypothetical protein GQ53DRAFT_740905 [Thozetella sp. PMI_491]|nr:hypothetical protein GQ53DRAFT_740905 [Thozetella sp. PMI_491]
MTQVGKCDICRRRKIKCDEVHPVCGGCKKKNRPCHYSYGKVSQFIDDGGIMMDGGKPLTIRRIRDAARATSTRQERPRKKSPEPDDESATPDSLLRLRSSRQAKDGSGLFQTFAPRGKKNPRDRDGECKARTPDSADADTDAVAAVAAFSDPIWGTIDMLLLLPHEPQCGTGRAVNQWLNITASFSENYGIPCILGEWMELVPPRLGNSQSIDSAVECFLRAVTANSNRTPENLAATDAANAKALRSIRADILNGDVNLVRNDVLIAICLLIFVEIFVRASSGEYKYHQTGLLSLINNITNHGTECSETIPYMVDTCVSWEFNPAIAQNRDSHFDSEVWVNIERPWLGWMNTGKDTKSFSLYLRSVTTIRTYWTQLPRLVRLVKAAAAAPDDESLREEATNVAFRLYSMNLDDVIQEFFDNGHLMVVATTAERWLPYLDHSLEFATYPLLAAFCNYWSIRILICGLVLHLLDMFPVMPSSVVFDYDEVAAHDLQCAKYVLMAVQYGYQSRTPLPIDYIRLMLPMQTAYFAYDRLETRAGGPDSSSLEAEHGRRMKEFSLIVLREVEMLCGIAVGGASHYMPHRHRMVTGRHHPATTQVM